MFCFWFGCRRTPATATWFYVTSPHSQRKKNSEPVPARRTRRKIIDFIKFPGRIIASTTRYLHVPTSRETKKTATATARSDPGQCAAAAGSPNLWNRGQRRVVNPCRFGKCGSRSGTAQGQTPFLSSPARRRRRRVTSSGRCGRGGHVAYRGEVCHGRQATLYGWGCVREVNFYFAVMLHSHSHSARGSWPSLAPVGKGRYAGTRTGCRTKAKAHMQLFLKL